MRIGPAHDEGPADTCRACLVSPIGPPFSEEASYCSTCGGPVIICEHGFAYVCLRSGCREAEV